MTIGFPSPPIAQFGRAASSRKSLGGSKLLTFKNDGGHCVLGDLQYCRIVLVAFPRSVPTQSCLGALRTIPSISGFGFCSDMNCQLWDLKGSEYLCKWWVFSQFLIHLQKNIKTCYRFVIMGYCVHKIHHIFDNKAVT